MGIRRVALHLLAVIMVASSVIVGFGQPDVRASGSLANLWIDPGGGNCVRQPSLSSWIDLDACGSFNDAYQAAQPGDIIIVKQGSYSGQSVLYKAAFEGASSNARIQVENNAVVTINGDITVGPDRGTKGATHLSISGAAANPIIVNGGININGCGAPADGQQCATNSGGNYLDFSYLKITDPTGFFCASCDHVSVVRSLIQGAATYNSPCTGSLHPEVQNTYDSILGRKNKRAHHLAFSYDTFQNYAICQGLPSSDHTECIQFEPADDVTLGHNIFKMCDTINVAFFDSLAGTSVSAVGQSAPNHAVIENNFFDRARNAVGDPAYYSLRVPSCTNCVIRNNSFGAPPLLPSVSGVYGNSFIGNAGPLDSCSAEGTSFSHNVWLGAKCGVTDVNVGSLGFVDINTTDLHLLSSSPAIDAGDPQNSSATDIDGASRYVGAAPDAGADEYGATGAKLGDVTNDGFINQADMDAVKAKYGQTISGWDPADTNADGKINIRDISIVLKQWGT